MLRLRLLLLLLGSLIAIPGLLNAQEEAPRQWVSVDFPRSVTFLLEATSSQEITQAAVRFQVEERSCAQVESTGYAELSPGHHVSTQWTWDMRKTGGLPPGAVVHYRWAITNASGEVTETPTATVEIVDQRHTWQTIQGNDITLSWYRGDEGFATALSDAAREAIARLEASTGTRPEGPVKLYIYGSASDLREALVYPQEWTGGVSFSSFNIVAIGIGPDSLSWGRRSIAHELTHVVIGQATHNCYSGLPSWLNEGLATYNEGDSSPTYVTSLEEAVESGRLISIHSLAGAFPTTEQDAFLAYGESRSLVEHLIEEFGTEKLNELLAAFRSGNEADAALRQVYGFDQAGLQERWRRSLGATPLPEGVSKIPPGSQVPLLPTFEPFSLATPAPSGTVAVAEPTATQEPRGDGLGCSARLPPAVGGSQPAAKALLLPIWALGPGLLAMLGRKRRR